MNSSRRSAADQPVFKPTTNHPNPSAPTAKTVSPVTRHQRMIWSVWRRDIHGPVRSDEDLPSGLEIPHLQVYDILGATSYTSRCMFSGNLTFALRSHEMRKLQPSADSSYRPFFTGRLGRLFASGNCGCRAIRRSHLLHRVGLSRYRDQWSETFPLFTKGAQHAHATSN